MPITITLDQDDLHNKKFMLATSRYFSDLAGVPASTSESQHTIKINVDTEAAEKSIERLGEKIAPVAQHFIRDDENGQVGTDADPIGDMEHSVTITAPVITLSGTIGASSGAGSGQFIRDDENEQVGVDADRPNVPAPDIADAEALPTAPADPSDIFGKASAPAVPAPPSGNAADVPTPPAAASSPASDVDTRGLPWDARIHSGSREKNADGSWRARRGVDKDIVPAIEQELREMMAIPSPLVVSGGKDTVYEIDTNLPVAQDVPPPPPVDDESTKVPVFVKWLMEHITAKRLTMAQANEAIASTGAKGLPDLTIRKDLIPAAKLAIEALLQ